MRRFPQLPHRPRSTGSIWGGGFGQARIDIDKSDINSALTGLGVVSPTTSTDEKDTTWKLFGGYQFNRNFAVELGYIDFGSFSADVVALNGRGRARVEGDAWSLDVVGMQPFGTSPFSLIGKLGVHRWEGKARLRATGAGGTASASDDDDGVSWKVGLGGRYDFTPNLGVRLEWDHFDDVGKGLAETDVNVWTLNLQFKF